MRSGGGPAPAAPAGPAVADLRPDDVSGATDDGLVGIVHLAADALDGAAAGLTVVEHDDGWTRVSTSEPAPVALRWCGALAERALGAPDGRAEVVAAADAPHDDLPVAAATSEVVTRAAHVVRTAAGEAVGALEIAWEGARPLEPRTWRALRGLAEQAARVLELGAEVSEYHRFVTLIPDPVTILDVDGTIEVANPAFVALLGYPDAGALVGERLVGLVADRDRDRVTSDLAQVLFERRPTARLELSLRAADGVEVPCSVSAVHLRGVRRHLQLVVHDLSRHLRNEAERSRLSEQLARAQRLDAVGRIAGGLAHDLNNLLGVMVANLSLARESLADLEVGAGQDAVGPVREDLDGMELAIDRAVDLTRGLLQFARREDGTERVADVGQAVEAVVGLVERSLGPGVRLELDRDPDLPDVAADPVGLERVLVNLVINAADAVAGAGTVRVEASLVDDGVAPDDRRAVVPRVRDGAARRVRIDVVDDGIGMDAATQARAFEPLFTTKGDTGGSGLGLATVAAFADAVDGWVGIESTPGEGTCVRLELPVVEAAPEVGSVDEPTGARVLLVDPSEATRRIIAEMLRAVGHQVRAVATGEEALKALDHVPPDLLISDLALPGISGPRLLAAARAGYPRLQAIVLASLDGPRTLDDSPLLVKPFSHDRLLRTVERVLADR